MIQNSNDYDDQNENIQEDNNIFNISENDNDINNEYYLNKPFIYNSQSEFYKKNNINNNIAKNLIDI